MNVTTRNVTHTTLAVRALRNLVSNNMLAKVKSVGVLCTV